MSQRMWINNMPPEASNEELVELVKKYSGHESKVVRRVEGDGKHPGCIVEFAALQFGELDRIVQRLQGLYWKQRKLGAYHPLHAD